MCEIDFATLGRIFPTCFSIFLSFSSPTKKLGVTSQYVVDAAPDYTLETLGLKLPR